MVKIDNILWINSAIFVLKNKIDKTKDFFKRKELKEVLKKIEFDKFKIESEIVSSSKENEEKKTIEMQSAWDNEKRGEEIKNRINSYL